MPLITIHFQVQAPTQSDSEAISALLARVRDQGARALDCPPDNLWVELQPIPRGFYLQGLKPSPSPFVVIRAQAGRTSESRRRLAQEVAAAVAEYAGVSEGEVWVHYQELNPGDVWFEGKWSSS